MKAEYWKNRYKGNRAINRFVYWITPIPPGPSFSPLGNRDGRQARVACRVSPEQSDVRRGGSGGESEPIPRTKVGGRSFGYCKVHPNRASRYRRWIVRPT